MWHDMYPIYLVKQILFANVVGIPSRHGLRIKARHINQPKIRLHNSAAYKPLFLL